MTVIDNLTDSAYQTTILVLPDTSTATITLRYRPRTQRWTMDVTYPTKNFQMYGLNVCTFPNALRPWRNVLPFGIAFMTADFTDPMFLSDFVSGRVTAYLLNASDVETVEQQIIGSPA